jgi:hypothetical protein
LIAYLIECRSQAGEQLHAELRQRFGDDRVDFLRVDVASASNLVTIFRATRLVD